jgi:(2R)-sulfolactate sulfo-lyase subunit alpha
LVRFRSAGAEVAVPVNFLVHHEGDDVGVAVEDIAAGTQSAGRYKDQAGEVDILVSEDVPLGHKLALHDIADGAEIIEYGVAIGRATADIRTGQYVHTHNLKGQRWY